MNPGWLIGILTMVYDIIPIELGSFASPIYPKQPGFVSLLRGRIVYKPTQMQLRSQANVLNLSFVDEERFFMDGTRGRIWI